MEIVKITLRETFIFGKKWKKHGCQKYPFYSNVLNKCVHCLGITANKHFLGPFSITQSGFHIYKIHSSSDLYNCFHIHFRLFFMPFFFVIFYLLGKVPFSCVFLVFGHVTLTLLYFCIFKYHQKNIN